MSIFGSLNRYLNIIHSISMLYVHSCEIWFVGMRTRIFLSCVVCEATDPSSWFITRQETIGTRNYGHNEYGCLPDANVTKSSSKPPFCKKNPQCRYKFEENIHVSWYIKTSHNNRLFWIKLSLMSDLGMNINVCVTDLRGCSHKLFNKWQRNF